MMATEALPANSHLRLESTDGRLLSAQEERELLRSLAECKVKLSGILEGAEVTGVTPPVVAPSSSAPEPGGSLSGADCWEFATRHYNEIRSRLALANVRLVSHFAKRYAARGFSFADLFQEGFCGLLEAIDRFDLGHQTRLSTYATWWIRQAMQRAVAAGAYPVRLSPRHLRQLARNQPPAARMGPLRSAVPPAEPTTRDRRAAPARSKSTGFLPRRGPSSHSMPAALLIHTGTLRGRFAIRRVIRRTTLTRVRA